MKTLDKRILELLNRQESDPTFLKFLDDLKLLRSPIEIQPDDSNSQYDFPEIGVSLLSINKTVWSATFYFSSYVNDMPFDLPQKATRGDVHKIFGLPSKVDSVALPWTGRYKSESHELKEFAVTCWYLSPVDRLDSIIVHRHDFLQDLKVPHNEDLMPPKSSK